MYLSQNGKTDIERKTVAARILMYVAIKPHILKRSNPINPIIAEIK